VVASEAQSRGEFLEDCRSGRLDGVVAIFHTYSSAQRTGLFDEELVRQLPASVKAICHNGE
jgi:glyoxylate reductase